jgi:DNA-binding FadR family transcriptional regulator
MKYLEIYSSLKNSIAEKKFSDDLQIPSEAELCEHFGVARNTVRQALAMLLSQGLIEKHKGKGSFITPKGERKTGVIGLLIPDFSSSSFFSSLKSELETNAAKLGYKVRLEASWRTTDDEMVKAIRKAARKLAVDRVEGVIFRLHLNPEHIEANKEILLDAPLIIRKSSSSPKISDSNSIKNPMPRKSCKA